MSACVSRSTPVATATCVSTASRSPGESDTVRCSGEVCRRRRARSGCPVRARNSTWREVAISVDTAASRWLIALRCTAAAPAASPRSSRSSSSRDSIPAGSSPQVAPEATAALTTSAASRTRPVSARYSAWPAGMQAAQSENESRGVVTQVRYASSVPGAPWARSQANLSPATALVPFPASAYRRSMSSRVASSCAVGTDGKRASRPTIHLNDQNSEWVSLPSNSSGRESHQRSSCVNGRKAFSASGVEV